jgi:hypothetical protein
MGQSSLRWTVRALHDRMSLPNGQKRANAGAKARTNQKLPTFPTSSALQTTKGDFHSVSPGIADRGRTALPHSQLAPLARPQSFRALRHHPELGRGGGEKMQTRELKPTTWIGP